MRTITGLIGRTNRDGYRLQTATATVGIRGTGYSVTYDAGGSVTIFVAEGATTVTNQAGTTTLPSGKSASVSGPNSPPSTSDEKPFLPPPGSGAATNVAGPQNATQDSKVPGLPDAKSSLPAAPLLTGEIVNTDSNIANLAYSNYDKGVDAVSAQPAILNAQGILTSVSASAFEGTLGSGSAQLSLAGNDSVIAWGRWIGGSTTNGPNLDSSGPFHWVVGLPVTNLPTSGTASYTALGATASCYSGCTSAVVTGSTLAVTFGPTSVNGNFTLGINIDSTPNNFSGTLFGGGPYSSSSKFTASSSGAGLSLNGQGFFAGPAASRAGMAYEVYGSIVEGPSIQVNGVVAYKKQ
jgi:hypothetical protein